MTHAYVLALCLIGYEKVAVATNSVGAIFSKADKHLSEAFLDSIKIANNHATKTGEGLLLDGFVAAFDPEDSASLRRAVCKVASRKPIAIVGPANSDHSDSLQKHTNAIGLPFFRVAWNYSSTYDGFRRKLTVNMLPHYSVFMKVVVQLISRWLWKKVLIVYVDDWAIVRFQHILIAHQLENVTIRTVQIEDGIASALDLIRKSDYRSIVLDLPPHIITEFFDEAMKRGMIDDAYHYLLTDTNILEMDLSRFKHNNGRISGFHLVSNESRMVDAVLRIGRHRWSEKKTHFPMTETAVVRDTVLAISMFGYHADLKEELSGASFNCTALKFNGDLVRRRSEKLIWSFRRHRSDPTLRHPNVGLMGGLEFDINLVRVVHDIDLYQMTYHGDMRKIGHWHRDGKFVNTTSRSDDWYAGHLDQDEIPHFRITTILEPPYTMLVEYPGPGIHQLEGFCVDLLEKLAIDLKFTYTIHPVKDGKYGDIVNGKWNGMIGEILRGEADLAVAPLTDNYKRNEVVAFTQPFLPLGISVLFRYPELDQPGLMSFMKPFSGSVWAAIVGSIFGTICLLFCLARLSPYEQYVPAVCTNAEQRPQRRKVNNYGVSNTIWFIFSTLLKGGCDFGPRSTATRIIGGVWWIFALIIVSAYTANLAAVLTVDRRTMPIVSLENLANQTDIQYGALDGGSTMQFFSESMIPAHRKIWQNMKKHPELQAGSNHEGVQKVLDNNYAFIMESTSLEYAVNMHCNLTQVGGVLGTKHYGIATAKGSKWIEPMTKKILEYSERHIIDQFKKKWWEVKGKPCSKKVKIASMRETRVSLNMDYVAGVFTILLVGLLIAFLVAIAEFMVKDNRRNRRRRFGVLSEMRNEFQFALSRHNARPRLSRSCSACHVSLGIRRQSTVDSSSTRL